MTKETIYGLLADVVLLVHFAFVAFVVLGLVVVWGGYFMRRACNTEAWVRNFWFRSLHLVSMGIVVLESVFGIDCPLTIWERDLRSLTGGAAYEVSFMEHWVHKIMFFELSATTFMVIYSVFFAAMVLSWIVIRPQWPWGRRGDVS